MKLLTWPVMAYLLIAGMLFAACSPGVGPAASGLPPDEAISAAIQSYLDEQGGPADQVEVQIQAIDGDYARVQIVSTDPASPGGFTGFLQQQDGQWRTLIVGSGLNPAEILDFGIPPSVLPEGWILPEEAAADTPPTTTASDTCPEASPDQQLLAYEALGYCFLFPLDYDVFQHEGDITLYQKSLLNVEAPFLSVKTEDARGRTADEVAEAFLADFQGFEIPRSEGIVGGDNAVILDNMPGQDINRRVLFVHEGRLFELLFSPVGADYGDIAAQTEALYTLVLNSFQFVPVVADAPLRDGLECPEADAETALIKDESAGYCLLIPAGYTAEQTSEDEKVVYVGSLLDVEHPKLFIQVEDAAGRQLDQITDELLAEFQAVDPGFQADSSFGLSVDDEWANLLDKLPGQDLNRKLLFIHDGRLYQLTFVPSDESAGQVYQEMLALYDLTLGSFSFLWQ